MEIREPQSFTAELIEVGSLEDWIAVRRDVSVTLIIGQDKHNVRSLASD